MKKTVLLLICILSGFASQIYGQTEWKPLFKDSKREYQFSADKNYFYIKIDVENFEVQKDKKLLISTDEYGYVNLTYKETISIPGFTIIKYIYDQNDKTKLIKSYISDVIINGVQKTIYIKNDSIISKSINDLIKLYEKR